MSSIFTKIINRDLPAYIVAEDNHNIAFLDIYPLVKGHVLVVPKDEVDDLFDIGIEKYLSLWKFAKKISEAMNKVITCKRIGIAVVGFDVPHAHIHLIPMSTIQDMNFDNKKIILSQLEFEHIALSIKNAISFYLDFC